MGGSIINLYTIIGGIGLLFSTYIFFKSKKSLKEVKNKAGEIYLVYKDDEKIKIALEAVSRINGEYEELKSKNVKIKEKIEDIKNNGVNLEFEDISKYCKSKDEKEGEQFYYIPNNPYLKQFQTDILLTSSYYSGNVLFVIDEILRLLDSKGDCSSVIQTEIKETAKTDKDKTTYNLLSKIDLARHSVNVAMNMYKKHSEGIKMLKAVVIGLTHDIGKIPEFYKEYSGMGKHNIVSTLVLNQIQHFNEIGIFEDIKEIIRQHHDYPKSDNDDIMLLSLREADQEARRAEIFYIDEKIKSESLHPINTVINNNNENSTNVRVENKNNEEKENIIVEVKKDNTVSEGINKVSFSKEDIVAFFKELLKHINVFQKENENEDKGKTIFLAFTCPKKNIFFQPNLALNIIFSLYPGKVKNAIEKKYEQDILKSFMNAVMEYYPDTINGYIKKNYFGNYFTLFKENNKETYMFLMSVNASIYSEIGEQKSFEEADNRRKDTIIEDIKSVKISGKKKNNIKSEKDPFDDVNSF